MFNTISQPRRASTPCIPPNMRRSVTLPAFASTDRRESLPRAVSRDSSSPLPTVETLYCHPNARIIAFTANAPDGSGSMSWSSPTERTIAVGPLRIYKTPNNVIFLNCGLDFVRPVFPKSKCWCVEDASGKFILEMRKPQYWRIEVPFHDVADRVSMEELKRVFADILLYEPFRRIFEPPPEPLVPIKYRPWTPKASPMPLQTDDTDVFSQAVPQELNVDRQLKPIPSVDNLSIVSIESRDSDDLSGLSPITESCPQQEIITVKPEIKPKTSIQPSLVAPPQLTVLTSPPSKKRAKSPLGLSQSSSSSGSFHSLASWHEPSSSSRSRSRSRSRSPVSDSIAKNEIHLPKRANRVTQESLFESEAILLRSSVETGSDDEFQDFPMQTLEIDEDHFAPSTNPSEAVPRRQTPPLQSDRGHSIPEHSISTLTSNMTLRRSTTINSIRQRREFSPMPNTINIFSPTKYRPRRLQTNKHLPTAILQKTCEILFSPPSHLVNLMLEWAARLTAGGWWGRENVGDGDVYCDGWGVGGWGANEMRNWKAENWELNEGDLDDYGMVVVNKPKQRNINDVEGVDNQRGRSWEID